MCLGGGGKTTTTSKPSKQTPLEQDVLGLSSGMYQQILSDMGYEVAPSPQRDFAGEIGDAQAAGNKTLVKSLQKEQKAAGKTAGKYGATPFTLSKRALTEEEQKQKDFETSLTKKYQDTISGGTVPQDVQDYIGQMFDTRQDEVQRQIDKSATAAAGSRGLGLSDTPIGGAYLRTTAEAAQNLRGQQAQALLGARSEELGRAGGYMTYLDTLKQLKGFQNPMGLASGMSGFGLGLYTPRFSKGTTTEKGGGSSAANLGGLLGGGGAFLESASKVASQVPWGTIGTAALALFSSRQLKENIKPFKENVLKMVRDTPIYEWHYKGDKRAHIGPVTEEAPKIMVSDDGMALVPIDYLGFLFAAIKALEARG